MRSKMVLLAQRGHTAPQIARLMLRSEDTVERVLKRFLAGGLDAVLRRTSPGRRRTVTALWERELVRVYLHAHGYGGLFSCGAC